MRIFIIFGSFFILNLLGCNSGIGPFERYVEDGSYINFTIQGKQYHIRDWVGGEAMPPSVYGEYGMRNDTSFF
jgi:hypothetical protein